MSDFEKSRPVFLHRSVLIDGFEAILAIHQSHYQAAKDDEYSKIYRVGFNDALLAFSKLIGYPLNFVNDNEFLIEAKPSNGTLHNNKGMDSLPDIIDKEESVSVSKNGNGISKNGSYNVVKFDR